MSNIKFVYLYRDGANYKSWGEVIFKNSEQLSLKEIENRLTSSILPQGWFVASQISIPEEFLFLKNSFTKYDHCYHEFDHVEICDIAPSDSLERSISDFLHDVEVNGNQGWKAFDVLDRA